MILFGLFKIVMLIFTALLIIGLIALLGVYSLVAKTRDRLSGRRRRTGTTRGDASGFHTETNGTSRSTASDMIDRTQAKHKIFSDDEGEYVDYEELK